MTRRRLYNPAQLTPEELKASFVAREDTLAEMLRLIGEQRPGHPCQHMMLIGPRGMGKTTLGLRLLHEILETPALVAAWQPVAFHEESYGVSNLADFWFTALNHLSRATEDARWADRAVSLARDERDDSRLAAYALAALMDYCQTSGKRLILFVENIDIIFKQLGDERQIHELRAALVERPEILLIGSANTVFETIYSHGEPLYEFFRLFILKGLGPEDTRRILATIAEDEGRPDVRETLDREHGRLETIRRMTGGNPRLLVLACRILIDSPLGSAFEDLERLIDEQTPYFKARIEELPVQARKVFHCLADGWRPMQAREVADAAKLSSSHASAQLRQLIEKGYVGEVTLPNEKRTSYEVGDRFYNIYYLLRFSRTGRDRLARLVGFLHDLFGPTGMRTMYPAALEGLRIGDTHAGEPSDLLGIVAGYVAEDEDFTGRDDWRRRALTLARDTLGPNAPVIAEIHESFSAYDDRASSDRLTELLSRSGELSKAGLFQEAEALCGAAVEEKPNDAGAWTALGVALLDAGRHRAAITAFDRVPDDAFPDDKSELRVLAAAALFGKEEALFQLKQYAEAVAVVKWFEESVVPDDSEGLLHLAACAYDLSGSALAKLNQHEEAMVAWERVAEYVRTDDPPELRHMAAKSLCAKGAALYELDRHEEAAVAWERVAEYVHVEDAVDLREIAATALSVTILTINKLEDPDKHSRACERAKEYVRLDDPSHLRYRAATGLLVRYQVLLHLERYDESNAVRRLASDYVRPDDPRDVREPIAALLATGASLLNASGRYAEAEAGCREATKLDPTHHESWRVLADAILDQNDSVRFAEAEDAARCAVELAPDSAVAVYTLGGVLALRGNWTAALDAFEHALRIGGFEFQSKERPPLTVSLCHAIAAGYAPRVKRIMEEFGLVESMEPLWHAVRLELGEDLEPLPAEIMDAVTDIRRNFIGNPDSPLGTT